MNMKKWAIKTALLAVIASCLSLSSEPVSASTTGGYNFQIPCAQAQNAVNFLLSLDKEVEEELAEGTISAAAAAWYDQYIDNSIAFIKAHVASTCSLSGTDND
jgi:hypothetical protein